MIAELLAKFTTEWAFHAFFVWKLALNPSFVTSPRAN
jgi:hypothetical protein